MKGPFEHKRGFSKLKTDETKHGLLGEMNVFKENKPS